ncbi:MAG: hypothetical protein Unbinned5081contig1000_23 [Prokaryotic dsDNA virus sp.]|nr:MAG: hypothetical protein Unbinned5081contig1000_23 [Prokaryotic dsDNA virus sp.]|tara:strand:+ start:2306 stop:2548 length:243 start_codon:yes stop_codon:yes gene_type:complete
MSHNDNEVRLTVEQYSDLKTDVAIIKRVLPELAENLKTHMDEEDGERKKIYRVLLGLGVLVGLQLFGIQLDPATVVSWFI